MNRLTDVTGLSGRDFSYGYDSVGNIETVDKTVPVESTTFTYNANNQVTGLTYDPDGNLTDDGVNVYAYDGLGQTTSVTHAGGIVSYVYDALGKRIVKSDLSGDVIYTYLGEQLLSEYDPTGGVFSDSVFMGGQLLARVIDDGVSVTDVSYAHLNHLGSPVAFTDGTAAVVWPEQVGGTPYEVHAYEPFGADFDDIGTPTEENKIRYTGKLFESDIGKHYFNARYLNAVTDTTSPDLPPRFLSPDVVLGNPGNGQSWNRYTSMANNPVLYIDPAGLAGYVFYDDDFDTQAEAQIKDWQNNRPDETLKRFHVESIADFENAIGQINKIDEEVNSLVLMFHGQTYYLTMGEGNELEYLSANNEDRTPRGGEAFGIGFLEDINFGENAYIGVNICKGGCWTGSKGINVGQAFHKRYGVKTFAYPYKIKYGPAPLRPSKYSAKVIPTIQSLLILPRHGPVIYE